MARRLLTEHQHSVEQTATVDDGAVRGGGAVDAF